MLGEAWEIPAHESRNGIVGLTVLPPSAGGNLLARKHDCFVARLLENAGLALNARTILERNSLFRGLSAASLDRIAALSSKRTFESESVLFMRGDPGDALFGVVSGRVRVSTQTPNGKEVILNVMKPGDVFGEIALLDGQPRTASATAVTSTQLIVIQRADFLNLLKREPQLAVHLIELLCGRVRWTSEQMEDTSLLNVPQRLAKCVLHLASSQGSPTPHGVQVKISQEQLAKFLGLSRQIVNKYLQTWKRKRWIALGRGKLIVGDERALLKLSTPE
jgi:CRP/FNR family transcriptional regulator, cyclic AMP receptor protein